MKTIQESPVLQSTARTGKKKFWQMVAFSENGSFYYQKSWWQEGSKVQSSTPTEVLGKNVGRANETSPRDQLLSEFDSRVKKQRDKGYSEDGSASHIPTKPMLANKYKDKKHLVTYPCFVQPKLDGFRMLKEGDGKIAYTRGGKEHTRECVEHLMWNTGNVMVDGELMLPGNRPLQETSRAAKKFREGVSPTLLYFVYDVVEPDMPFAARSEMLRSLVDRFGQAPAPANVVLVETLEVASEKELFEAHKHFTSQGFEGTIVRSGQDGYNIGHRSSSLLKVKDFQDAEFRVVDIIEGRGSFKGKAICVCETDSGKTFKAVPEGSSEHRREIYTNRDEYIGKWLTVRFQTYSNSGTPTGNTVGVDFREDGEF